MATHIPVIEHNDIAQTTAKGKTNVFRQAFGEKSHLANGGDQPPKTSEFPRTMLENVKPKHIKKIVQQLQPDNASGPDNIRTRVLKESSADLAGPLCHLFSMIYSRRVPNLWKTASVTPIHRAIPKLILRNAAQVPCLVSPLLSAK